MILGIDAFNINSGGGLTHLVEILSEADPSKHGFKKIIIWGNVNLLSKIKDKDWLQKEYVPILNKGLLYRIFWHKFIQKHLAKKNHCDIVFAPGGIASSGFSPIVTMSRNMLPFEWKELRRFGFSLLTFKLIILRFTQLHSFKKANGLIFLTQYAKEAISKFYNIDSKPCGIIPHGVSPIFFKSSKMNKNKKFSSINPCRILYVSNIAPYKHQWNVIEAVSLLRNKNIPITLDLVGKSGPGLKKMEKIKKKFDPEKKFVFYHGEVLYDLLPDYYYEADISVFASSCENMPNTLLEGMASGTPIACSSMGPMPEIIGKSELYFDPLKPEEIASVLEKMFNSVEIRKKNSKKSVITAKKYNWKLCADRTFAFLKVVAELN